jgi:peptidoglycan/xylan/chitin deacetylase (PgdA/CDA1 family)
MFAEWLQASRGYLSGWKRRSARRRGIRVLRYHGVVEGKRDQVLDRNQHVLSIFRAQMNYLRRFRVMSMGELLDELDRPPHRRPAAMVTFDDGFFNNMKVAEVLAGHRIPWSIFVPSGEVGPRRTLWSVEVSLLLMRGRAETVDALGRTWSLRSRAERERTFTEMRAMLKAIPSSRREQTVTSLRAQFPAHESDRLLDEEPQLRMLTWDELSELSAAGVEIGSHGCHHEIHHAGQPEEVRVQELVESRSELEKRLARPCVGFAYPNGNYVGSSPREVESAGYELGFTTETGTLDGKTRADRFLLPRLSASGSFHGFVRSFWWRDTRASRSGTAVTYRPAAT